LALWATIIAIGLYHGLNPGLGWPLAVSAALLDGGGKALAKALAALAAGHFLAMTAVLLPFAALTFVFAWHTTLQVVAGVTALGAGTWLLVDTRHPRFLSRIGPSRIGLWSFAMALTHGAGLMLLPLYLGLCTAMAPMNSPGPNVGLAVAVSLVHSVAMMVAAGGLAFAAWRWFGPRFISQAWFNLDTVWALSLIVVGAAAIVTALP
jgi:hypothetical protein